MDDPGPTCDLTIIATAAAAAGAAEGDSGGGGSGAGTQGETTGGKATGSEGQKKRKRGALTAAATVTAAGAGAAAAAGGAGCTRSFAVHRAILAARCPYFATHFASGLGDSNTCELHMPDTDPDALAALLRFMYGGELRVASREQARSCLELADRLLLPTAVGLLRDHLLSTLSTAAVVADLVWAACLAEGQGQEELLTGLVDYAAEQEADMPEEQVAQLAAAHPVLMAQLFRARVRAAKRLCTASS
eukprot:XP_001690225.1 predicted protein [Chlamydomonas reinhardtii]